MDPHYPRRAMEPRDPPSDFSEEVRATGTAPWRLPWAPALTCMLLQDWASYHTDVPRTIDLRRLDPSLLLGFYCRTCADLDDFYRRVGAVPSTQRPV
jgi:hypothetical protein